MDEKFAVWVSVEHIIEDGEEAHDHGLPQKLAQFSSYEKASAFVRRLPGYIKNDGGDFDEEYDVLMAECP